MGSYVFHWDHPASEVFITGTFDDWGKTIKLDKKEGTTHEKEIFLPSADDKVLYKYVVDGNWTTDHTKPTENDIDGNTNNVLLPSEITKRPANTSDLPGAFPETPAAGEQEVKVNPLPGTSGIGNPVTVRPGDKLPATSSITSNTIQTGVTLDKESYEKSGSGGGPFQLPNPVTPEAERQANGAGLFGLPETSKNMIPESSLPIAGGSGLNTVQSVGSGATTAQLAGQVPKEPRGTATVVDNTDPTIQSVGAGSTTAQLAGQVPKEPKSDATVIDDTPKDSTGPNIQSVGKGATTTQLAGNVPKEPRGTATVVDDTDPTIQTVGAGATTVGLAGQVPKEGSSHVPGVVQDSQKEANASPEASANPEAVKEKAAMESELEKRVPEQPPATESTIGGKAAAITAGAAATAGAAIAGAAAYVTSGKATEDAKSSIPQSVKDKLPESLKDRVASNGSTVASAVPEPVQESISRSNQPPEAAASSTAVKEKSAVESELLKKVPTEHAAGEPAPEAAITAATTTTAPTPMMKSTETPLQDTKPDNSKSTAAAIAPAADTSKSTAQPVAPAKSPVSRDISPMTRPDDITAAGPSVTTGVASSSTPKKSTAAALASPPVSPKSGGAASSDTTPHLTTDKKAKRRSGFFQKIRELAHRHKKDEK